LQIFHVLCAEKGLSGLTIHHLPAETQSDNPVNKQFNSPVGAASTAEAVTAPLFLSPQLFNTTIHINPCGSICTASRSASASAMRVRASAVIGSRPRIRIPKYSSEMPTQQQDSESGSFG
jgi:hypothetical protein